MTKKADYFIQRMNNNENKDILIIDLIETLNEMEIERRLFDQTEKERMRLLNQNNLLKTEIGKLSAVRILMERAEIYGYEDINKSLVESKE